MSQNQSFLNKPETALRRAEEVSFMIIFSRVVASYEMTSPSFTLTSTNTNMTRNLHHHRINLTARLHKPTKRLSPTPARSPLLPPSQDMVHHLRKNRPPLPRSLPPPQPTPRGQGWTTPIPQPVPISGTGEFRKRHQVLDGKIRSEVQRGQGGGGKGRGHRGRGDRADRGKVKDKDEDGGR